MAKKDLSRQKKVDTRIDFTPMVDMNMLLITFFMLCTTMIKSQTLQIALPTNEDVAEEQQNDVKQSEAITIIVDGALSKDFQKHDISKSEDGLIYYYQGFPFGAEGAEQTAANNNLKQIDRKKGETIRTILRENNKEVLADIATLKERWKKGKINDSIYQDEARKIRNNDKYEHRPVVMIKATPNASYADVVNILDEMQVNQISRFQIETMNHTDSVMMLLLQGKPIQ